MKNQEMKNEDDKKASRMSAEELRNKALARYRYAFDAAKDNYEQARLDKEFVYLDQWDAAVREAREKENRPCLQSNRLEHIINLVVNQVKETNFAIKVAPVDDFSDRSKADAVENIIRHIERNSSALREYMNAFEDSVSSSLAYLKVSIDESEREPDHLDIKIKCIEDPLSVFIDPMSRQIDGADMNYAIIVHQYSKEEFKREYPDASAEESDFIDLPDWLQNDLYQNSGDNTQTIIKVLEYWYKEDVEKTMHVLSNGAKIDEALFSMWEEDLLAVNILPIESMTYKTTEVKQVILSGAEILKEDIFIGSYIPIVPVYGKIRIINGKRHFFSLIRPAKDEQRTLNIMRTYTAEYAMSAPMNLAAIETGSVENNGMIQKVDGGNLKVLYMRPGSTPPIFFPGTQPPVTHYQEYATAVDGIKATTGFYDPALGNRSNETSGVAIQARQAQTDVSTYHFFDNLKHSIKFIGKLIVSVIPYVYQPGRILKVQGEEEKDMKSIQIGTAQQRDANGNVPEVYDICLGSYDIDISAGASSRSRRQESLEFFMNYIAKDKDLLRNTADLFIKNTDIKEADELAERFIALMPPPIQALARDKDEVIKVAVMQAQQQFQAQVQPILQQGQQLITKLQQENAELKQKTAIESGKLKVDEFEAQTGRMKVMNEIAPGITLQEIISQVAAQAAQNTATQILTALNAPMQTGQAQIEQATPTF